MKLNANQYVIIDNLEGTGLVATNTSSPNYFVLCGRSTGAFLTVENVYLHGWHTAVGVTGTPGSQAWGFGCGVSAQGDVVRYTVVDGTDSSQNMLYTTNGSVPVAYGNIMRYVVGGLDGCGDNWHDNLVEYLVQGVTTAHQDALYQKSQCGYSPIVTIYNNVVRNMTNPLTGGAVKLWIMGNNGSSMPAGESGYVFNNLIYNTYPGNTIDTCAHTAANCGTWYFFNNTFQCGMDSVAGNCAVGIGGIAGQSINLYFTNNHWIQSGTTSPVSCSDNPGVCTETNGVFQTLAQAKAQGYTDTSAYAFQPTSASGSTVTAAANAATASTRQSLCTTIGAVDAAAGAACQGDTTYACAYEITDHTVRCPARQSLARAAEPNIGAYQFSSVEASMPNPPAGLTVSVQ